MQIDVLWYLTNKIKWNGFDFLLKLNFNQDFYYKSKSHFWFFFRLSAHNALKCEKLRSNFFWNSFFLIQLPGYLPLICVYCIVFYAMVVHVHRIQILHCALILTFQKNQVIVFISNSLYIDLWLHSFSFSFFSSIKIIFLCMCGLVFVCICVNI